MNKFFRQLCPRNDEAEMAAAMLWDAICADVEGDIRGDYASRLRQAERAMERGVSKMAWDYWRQVDQTLAEWHAAAMLAAFNAGWYGGLRLATVDNVLAGLPQAVGRLATRFESRFQREMRDFCETAAQPDTGTAVHQILKEMYADMQTAMCRRGWEMGWQVSAAVLAAKETA